MWHIYSQRLHSWSNTGQQYGNSFLDLNSLVGAVIRFTVSFPEALWLLATDRVAEAPLLPAVPAALHCKSQKNVVSRDWAHHLQTRSNGDSNKLRPAEVSVYAPWYPDESPQLDWRARRPFLPWQHGLSGMEEKYDKVLILNCQVWFFPGFWL